MGIAAAMKRKTAPSCRRAFNLIELMIGLALVALIGIAVYLGFGTQTKNQLLQQDLAKLQQEMRNVDTRLTQELRQFIPINSRSNALQLSRLFQWKRGCTISKSSGTIDAPFTDDAAAPADCVRLLSMDEARPTAVLGENYNPADPGWLLLSDSEAAKLKEGTLYVLSDGNYSDPFLFKSRQVLGTGQTRLEFDPTVFHDSAGFGGVYSAGSQILPAQLTDYAIDRTYCLEVTCDATAPTLIAADALQLLAPTIDRDRYYRPLASYFDEFRVTFYVRMDNAPTGDPLGNYQFLRSADFLLGGRTTLSKGNERDLHGNPVPLRANKSGHVLFTRFRSSDRMGG